MKEDIEFDLLRQASSDFWNFGYADYDLDTDDQNFDELDLNVVETIFKAGWEAKDKSLPWINIGLKIPEENEYCLTVSADEVPHCPTGRISIAKFSRKYGFSSGGDVTHWMPLPSLPNP